jgi:hypothetical protein
LQRKGREKQKKINESRSMMCVALFFPNAQHLSNFYATNIVATLATSYIVISFMGTGLYIPQMTA